MYKYYKILITTFLISQQIFAQDIKVQCIIKTFEGKPIRDVSIIIDGILIGTSDDDGKSFISVKPNAELFFYKNGYNDLKMQVSNRQILNITLNEKSIEIDEVLVLGKTSKKKILVDKTDLEVVGSQFLLKTKFRIPKHIFNAEKRFIVQPTLYNATLQEFRYFRPVVIEGAVYTRNRYRVDEFDQSKDLLRPYIEENNISETDYIYSYSDSLDVKTDAFEYDYRAECYLAVNEIHERPSTDYLDTVVIARGTKNPLRFLDYKFEALELNDSLMIPKPEVKLMSDIGVSKIGFKTGKAKIDSDDPNNQRELELIKDKIQSILNNEFATLQSISVTGYASPEGIYESNVLLAKKRTDLIQKEISSSLKGSQKEFIKLVSSSVVEPWSRLAQLLEEDTIEIASKVREVVFLSKDNYERSQSQIRQLPEYKEIIVNRYLPLLRRTEYALNYSIFRNLTDKEIIQRYNRGQVDDISRFEYWRLIKTAVTREQKESFEELALKAYPNFTLVANRVAVRLLQKDSLNLNILLPSINDRAPFEVIYNQSLMALGLREIELADSLLSLLPTDSRISYLKAVSAALNGDFERAYPLIASRGGLNEVLILLCTDRNKEASEKIALMLENPANAKNAKYWYIRAVCANRLDDLSMSMNALTYALSLDPSLEIIARLDSDLIDIIEIVSPKE